MLVGVVLGLLGLVVVASAELYCTSPVTLTIHSHRNQTGQWTAKVDLEHPRKSGPWVLKTDLCEDGDIVRISSTIAASGSAAKKVPADYTHFPGVGYYKFNPNGTTWQTARLACADEGAHLAVINSEAEADVMAQLFARYPKPLIKAGGNDDWAWVGAREMGVDGEYFTIFNEPLATTGFTRWVKGQPDDTAVDTAVVTNRGSGGLGDAYPAWTAAFVCEV